MEGISVLSTDPTDEKTQGSESFTQTRDLKDRPDD